MPEFPNDFSITELVALAQTNGFPGFPKSGPTKGIPREALIKMLLDLKGLENPEPLSAQREKYEKWMKKYWARLRSQVKKPICPECSKGKVVKGSFNRCSDVAFAFCFVTNKSQIL